LNSHSCNRERRGTPGTPRIRRADHLRDLLRLLRWDRFLLQLAPRPTVPSSGPQHTAEWSDSSRAWMRCPSAESSCSARRWILWESLRETWTIAPYWRALSLAIKLSLRRSPGWIARRVSACLPISHGWRPAANSVL